MAAINQDAERNSFGPAEVKKTIHRGANGTTRVENVVHKDEVHAVYFKFDVGRLQDGLRSNFGKVVSIEGDVENSDGNFHTVNAAHGLRDALSQRNAAPADADEGQMLRAAAFLDNFMGNAL